MAQRWHIEVPQPIEPRKFRKQVGVGVPAVRLSDLEATQLVGRAIRAKMNDFDTC